MHKTFVRNSEGSVAFLFALALFVVLGLSGLAIDQSVGYSTRMSLQAATDAAVLTTTKSLADGDNWGQAKSKGEHIFNANMASISGSMIKLSNAGTPGNYKVDATAQAPWKRTITFLFDAQDRQIRISSSSTRQRKPVEVIFLADVSWSMGIGASSKDVSIMMKSIGCAFACHYDKTDAWAHKLGARLRIDVIQDAYREAINEIKQTMSAGDTIGVGLITFSNTTINSVEPTTDLNSAYNNASLIKFPEVTATGQGGTNLHAAASAAAAMVTARKLKNPVPTTYVVVWLTDAVEDTKTIVTGRVEKHDYNIPITTPNGSVDATATLMTFATDLCDGVKKTGAVVMVMNTDYVTDGYGSVGAGIVKNKLKPVMSARINMCASSSDYVKLANDPASILDAVVALTKLAISKDLRVAN